VKELILSVILHIGVPKTGSTYLQEWLALNAQILAESGVTAISSAAAHRFGVEAFGNEGNGHRSDIAAIRDSCGLEEAIAEVQAAGNGVAVISSEYFHTCPPARVKEIFDGAALEVTKILCFLRRQDRLCASGYAQEVKALGLSTRLTDAVYTDLLDWNVLLETWQSAFPDASVVFENFDKCRAESSLVTRFKQAIGIDGIHTDDPQFVSNPSLSAEMTELARLLNERQKSYDLKRLFEIQRHRQFTPFSFNKKLTAQFEELFRPSNERFAKRFPGSFDDYALPGWQPNGKDMTDQLDEHRLAGMLIDFVTTHGEHGD
jgi:hypothetical protein